MSDKFQRFLRSFFSWLMSWWLGIVIILIALLIRTYQLDILPVAPYWEEVALAVDSWSLLKTGRDHHGVFLPIAVLESYGDWKPSGYFYTATPFLAFFNLTVLAIRLPAALAGVSLVAAVGILAFFLWRKRWVSMVAMLLTAVSSWGVLFSRGAWEVNLATAFMTWGVVFLLLWKRAKKVWPLLAAVVLMTCAAYTYHATRFVAPVLGLVFAIHTFWSWRHQLTTKKLLVYALVGILATCLNLPWVNSFGSGEANKRLAETSALVDVSIVERVNEQRLQAHSAWWTTYVYHRYWEVLRIMSENALAHFNPRFLFLTGDDNPRHSTQYFGLLYPLDLGLLVMGIFGFLKTKRWGWGLAFWAGVTLLPVSMTKATPHALRTLVAFPVVMLVLTAGVVEMNQLVSSLLKKYKKNVQPSKLFWIGCASLYLLQFGAFWHHYSTVYAVTYSHLWQYGYEGLYSELEPYIASGNSLYISRVYGRPAMYYWFYDKTDPTQIQAEEGMVPEDQGERLAFNRDTIFFFRDEHDLQDIAPGSLIVASPPEFEKILPLYPNLVTLKQLTNLHGETFIVIFKVP